MRKGGRKKQRGRKRKGGRKQEAKREKGHDSSPSRQVR